MEIGRKLTSKNMEIGKTGGEQLVEMMPSTLTKILRSSAGCKLE